MKICPNCGEKVKDDKKFCPKCGSSLTVAQAEKSGSSNNSKILIVAVAAIICVAIIAGAYVLVNNNGSDDVVVTNDTDSDDSVEESDTDSNDDKDSSDSLNIDDALLRYTDTDKVLMTIAFNEADANDDDLLSGSEVSEYDRLAQLGRKYGIAKYAEPHEEHGAITRYCTTHGRVATGEDFKCPYCIEDGIDPVTVKDSTKYNQ